MFRIGDRVKYRPPSNLIKLNHMTFNKTYTILSVELPYVYVDNDKGARTAIFPERVILDEASTIKSILNRYDS